MYIKDIYEAVVMSAACPQPKFLSCLDTTVRSLTTKYGFKRIINDNAYAKPVDINGDLPVKDEYFNAIVDNILYLVTQNPDYKTDFMAEAEYAYKSVWRKANRTLKMVGKDYYNV